MLTQTDDILAHLQRGETITPGEAWERYGIARLGARIWDIKQAGFDVQTERIEVSTSRGRKARIARYSMKTTSGN